MAKCTCGAETKSCKGIFKPGQGSTGSGQVACELCGRTLKELEKAGTICGAPLCVRTNSSPATCPAEPDQGFSAPLPEGLFTSRE